MLAMAEADNFAAVMGFVVLTSAGCSVAAFLAVLTHKIKQAKKEDNYRLKKLKALVRGLQILTAMYEQERADIILTHKKCKNCGSKKHVDDVVPVESLDGKTVPMCGECRSLIGDES